MSLYKSNIFSSKKSNYNSDKLITFNRGYRLVNDSSVLCDKFLLNSVEFKNSVDDLSILLFNRFLENNNIELPLVCDSEKLLKSIRSNVIIERVLFSRQSKIRRWESTIPNEVHFKYFSGTVDKSVLLDLKNQAISNLGKHRIDLIYLYLLYSYQYNNRFNLSINGKQFLFIKKFVSYICCVQIPNYKKAIIQNGGYSDSFFEDYIKTLDIDKAVSLRDSIIKFSCPKMSCIKLSEFLDARGCNYKLKVLDDNGDDSVFVYIVIGFGYLEDYIKEFLNIRDCNIIRIVSEISKFNLSK